MNVPETGRIGETITATLRDAKDWYGLLRYAFGNAGRLKSGPIRDVFMKQVYFTGIEALGNITIMALLIGVVIMTQIANLAGSNATLMGRILVWTVVRELGPLFSAIIIIARSCTATSAELGSMKVNGEVEIIYSMGIEPLDYLITPRIWGITVSVVVLTFYFQITAVLGGLFFSALIKDVPMLQLIKMIFSALRFLDITVSFFKSLVFGAVISIASCRRGLGVRSSITEIPQAATGAVMTSLFLVFIFDGLITLGYFL